MRIAFLGPEGTFSEEALNASAGAGHEHVPLGSIYETIMAVHERTADRAIVPIENSLEGSVSTTLDTLAFDARDVHIVREVALPIRNRLIARAALPLEQVRRVISHPQAKAQCSRFLRERLPQAELVAADSTADAVRQVAATDRDWAALGTALSAELYGCTVLAEGIDDSEENRTRFVYLSPQAEADPAGPEAGAPDRPWKTSIVCAIARDRPGALLEILRQLADRDVNLTKLESRPAKTGLGAYVFFMDIEGGAHERAVAAALEALHEPLTSLRVLGSYQVG